jgi:hypothetical protein
MALGKLAKILLCIKDVNNSGDACWQVSLTPVKLALPVSETLAVSELMGRVRNVTLMNVCLGLENPGRSGFRVEGYMSQVREMGKSVYEQPGNEVGGSYHSQEGSK